MRRIVLVFFILGMGILIFAFCPISVDTTDEITEIVTEFERCFKEKDIYGLEEICAEDISFIGLNGEKTIGADEFFRVLEMYDKYPYATPLTMPYWTHKNIYDDFAYFLYEESYQIQKDGSIIKSRPYQGTILLEKREGKWKVIHFHYSSMAEIIYRPEL